jgi:hypothetical protein
LRRFDAGRSAAQGWHYSQGRKAHGASLCGGTDEPDPRVLARVNGDTIDVDQPTSSVSERLRIESVAR